MLENQGSIVSWSPWNLVTPQGSLVSIIQEDCDSTKPLNRNPENREMEALEVESDLVRSQGESIAEPQASRPTARWDTPAWEPSLTVLPRLPAVTLSIPWAPPKPSMSSQASRPWPTSTRASSTLSPCGRQRAARALPCLPARSRYVRHPGTAWEAGGVVRSALPAGASRERVLLEDCPLPGKAGSPVKGQGRLTPAPGKEVAQASPEAGGHGDRCACRVW